jgi:hypothetical protein
MIPRKPLIIAIAALLVLLIGYKAIFTWPAEKQALEKQIKLVAAIESRKWGRVHRLTSENYKDSLGLDREDLLLAFKDLGSQFRSRFELNWEMTGLETDGDAIVITGNMRLDGEGGPFAPMAIKHAHPYAKTPFTFRWRKSGILPWKWQLESVHHPDARLPEGYSPGDVKRRVGFGEL